MNHITDRYTLRNGYQIPCLGFGTWNIPVDKAKDVVKEAISIGYRHIDAAYEYSNEKEVGQGIKDSGIKREDIFITSKLWNTDRGYKNAFKALDKTLKNLQTDYLDLYLIHWPASEHQFENYNEINLETWRALIKMHKEGKIRAIGVSNFLGHHLQDLMKTEVPPMVNQLEYHPGYRQEEIVEYCKKNNILVEAWSPLATGKMLESQELKDIAKNYEKTVAQICLKWCLQNQILPIVKSITKERIIENTKLFDFEINKEDMEKINKMPYFAGSGLHPDKVSF